MRVDVPCENIKNFSHTFKVDRELFLLYEFLSVFNDSYNINNDLVEKKLKDLINYLCHIIYPLPPHNYAYIGEDFSITDYYEKEKF